MEDPEIILAGSVLKTGLNQPVKSVQSGTVLLVGLVRSLNREIIEPDIGPVNRTLDRCTGQELGKPVKTGRSTVKEQIFLKIHFISTMI